MEKQYGYRETEKQRIKQWLDHQVYKFDPTSNKPLFSIDTPPPTVSGTLHIGHIFSYTQTDIIARYKRMLGYNVFYPFGFDDNGLPTERFVEKKVGVSGYKLGRSAFIDLCLQESHAVEKIFKDLWQHMGLSVDWDYTYSTIEPRVRKLSQESFIELYKKGYVYRKQEPALYCTTCFTSVAQAELDDQEMPSIFHDLVFTLEDGRQLIVATTRPELLASCVAVFYHPHDDRYNQLHGKTITVPFYNTTVTLLPDENVIMDKGTGLVMCCTFGDKKDVEWYKKYNLAYKESIGRDGRMTALTGPLAGLKVKEAREKIVELLQAQNVVTAQKSILHNVNVHERCKKEIEIIEIPQWFVKILDFKQKFIEEADRIQWHPAYMKSRYVNWVENIGWDWCISRQRFYGIPFPTWYCSACHTTIVASVDELPVDPQETQKGCACGNQNLIPDTDVMDTWNTSSITPYICASFLNEQPFAPSTFIPMGMRPQAHDIIRTWAFYTIVKAWMHSGAIPWHDIVISGHVLAAGKEKISKSKGNEPFAPENLLNTFSADAIRYWTASGSLGQDTAFSETQLKIGTKLITKLWNAFKVVQEHGRPCSEKVQPTNIVNRWILHRLATTFKGYKEHLDKNEFGLALQQLETFFWADFCDNYVEIIKNQFFQPELYTQAAVTETRAVLFDIGFALLQLYAPYVPFITEELYEGIYKEHVKIASLHQTTFSIQEHHDDHAVTLMHKILELIEKVRKLKTEQQRSLKADVHELTISCTEPVKDVIKEHEQLIKGVTRALEIRFITQETGDRLSVIEDMLLMNIQL